MIKGKLSKLDVIKTNIICYVKDSFKSIRSQARDWEKIFTNYIANKEVSL